MFKKGFSAVEVMISLIVAVLMITAAYGLHIHNTRSTAASEKKIIAANIAETHLKKRAIEVDKTICSIADNKKEETPLAGEKLAGLKIVTDAKCEDLLIRVSSKVEYKVLGGKYEELQVLYVEK